MQNQVAMSVPVSPRAINDFDASAEAGQPWTALHLRFDVSLDEEHVFLHVMHQQIRYDFGERVHHYLLLILTRHYLADRARGLDASSQGWIDSEHLARMTGLDAAHLNIQIFRLRSQLARVLPPMLHPDRLIERRRGQIRFGGQPVTIMRGSVVEAR